MLSVIYNGLKLVTVFQITNIINIFERSVKKAKFHGLISLVYNPFMESHSSRMEEILDRFPQIKRNALIPLLQAVQDEFGYISEEAVASIGSHLSLPTSKVYGLATFYNQFSFLATRTFTM